MRKGYIIIKSITLILILVINLTNCSSFGTKPIEAKGPDVLKSKFLKPTRDKALIYIFRGPGTPSRVHPLQVYLGIDNYIGKISADQYLYTYSYPQTLYLRNADDGVTQVNIFANKTYYFMYGYEVTWIIPFSPEPFHIRNMPKHEGRQLLQEYKLSGDFKVMTIAYNKSPEPEYYNILNSSSKTTNTNETEFMSYNDSTKIGVITLNTDLKGRADALKLIGEICSSKNISLKAGKNTKIDGAVYKVLDESYSRNKLTINYNCLY